MHAFFVRLILFLIAGISWFALTKTAYAVEDLQPAALEIALESRLYAWRVDSSRLVYAHELEAGIGLAWYPSEWVALHVRIALGWNAVFDDAFSYQFHNGLNETSNLMNLEIAAFIDVHPAIRVLMLRAELSADSYFVKNRAGIWVINAGIGIGARPFVDLYARWRSVYFGIICRFSLFDKFEKIFSAKRKMPQIGIQISWDF